MSALARELGDKIASRSARTGVVGLGYVGLPLAVEFARSGFHTTGIDLDGRKIEAINAEKDGRVAQQDEFNTRMAELTKRRKGDDVEEALEAFMFET